MNKEENVPTNDTSKFQLICAGIMALFAAMGVLSSTYSGITATDWLNSSQVAAQTYAWYQAKSIKETIMEGQRNFALSLKKNMVTNPEQTKAINDFVAQTNKQIERINNDKNEILKGSNNIDKSKWSQDVNGKFGQIVGAKELDATTQLYSNSSDYFTYATVYIQLALVLGALALIISECIPRHLFFMVMVGLGLYGSYLALHGYILYSAVG
ncbi:MAG: DUF4337 family protein [bacterium]|nr:DUF4337 family protein [bacterium]